MIHSFRGRFEIKADPKGRLSLPVAFRDSRDKENTRLVITNSRYQNNSCLHVYTISEWQDLEKKIGRLSPLNADVQAFQRFYIAGGQIVELDSQGRILIPQSLRKFAGLNSEVILVGLGEKFEIWSQETWDQIYGNLSQSFETTMASVAKLLDGTGGDNHE